MRASCSGRWTPHSAQRFILFSDDVSIVVGRLDPPFLPRLTNVTTIIMRAKKTSALINIKSPKMVINPKVSLILTQPRKLVEESAHSWL